MSRPERNLPYNYPDRAMRDALLEPGNLRALVRRVAPTIAEYLDYERMKLVGKPYFLDDWRSRDKDILVAIPHRGTNGEREFLVCILIEHQSDADQAMPLRMLVYAVFYWEQQWKEWEDGHRRGQPLRLTPVLPIVLHTGPQPWDTNRSLADLFDVPPELQSWLPSWMMPLWDLPEHPAAELVQSDDAFWQALAVVRAERAPAEDFLETLRQALVRMEPLGTEKPVRWHQLLRMVLYWAIWRRPHGEHAAVKETALTSHTNVELQKEIGTMSQQTEKTWEEERTEQLSQQLSQQLSERFLSQGEARGLRFTLQTLLEQRFHPLTEELLQRIATADADRLKAAISALLTIQSPDELKL